MEIQYQVNIVKIPLPSWNQRSILLVATTVTYGNYGSTILFAWTTDIKHIRCVCCQSHIAVSVHPVDRSSRKCCGFASVTMTMWSPHLRRVEQKHSCDLHKISGHIRSYLGEFFIVGLMVMFIVGYVDILWYKAGYNIQCIYIYYFY